MPEHLAAAAYSRARVAAPVGALLTKVCTASMWVHWRLTLEMRTSTQGADSGTFNSADNGGSWAPGDFYPLAFDLRNPNTIYARVVGHDGVSKSTDGGATWISVNTGLNNYVNVSVLAIDPSNSEVIYAGTDGVFKSSDGGGSWSAIGNLYYPASL